jgi:hypothetical protein
MQAGLVRQGNDCCLTVEGPYTPGGPLPSEMKITDVHEFKNNRFYGGRLCERVRERFFSTNLALTLLKK